MTPGLATTKPQLQPLEDLVCGLHRVAMSEIAYAFQQLDRIEDDPPARIHECRKTIKRLRALNRLAQPRRGKALDRVDRLLREAGSALSAQRDADVMVATAGTLLPNLAPGDFLIPLQQLSADAKDIDSHIDTAFRKLSKVRRRIATNFDTTDPWTQADLIAGVVQEYRHLRRNARHYLRSESPAAAHDLRKSVQRHLAQMRVLARVAGSSLDQRLELLNDVAQKLGVHHDLAVLIAFLEKAGKSIPKPTRKALRKAARKQQRGLDDDLNAAVLQLVRLKPAQIASELTGDRDKSVEMTRGQRDA